MEGRSVIIFLVVFYIALFTVARCDIANAGVDRHIVGATHSTASRPASARAVAARVATTPTKTAKWSCVCSISCCSKPVPVITSLVEVTVSAARPPEATHRIPGRLWSRHKMSPAEEIPRDSLIPRDCDAGGVTLRL